MTAFLAHSKGISVDFTYRELHLDAGSLAGGQKSMMIGLSYRSVPYDVFGFKFEHIERIGYINWDGTHDDFGFYLSYAPLFRYVLPSDTPNTLFFLGFGADINFEFGFFDSDIYVFNEIVPIVAFGFQMPEIGFNSYAFFSLGIIPVSQCGSVDLDYETDPIYAFSVGLEYCPPEARIYFAVEFTLLRETSISASFGLRF